MFSSHPSGKTGSLYHCTAGRIWGEKSARNKPVETEVKGRRITRCQSRSFSGSLWRFWKKPWWSRRLCAACEEGPQWNRFTPWSPHARAGGCVLKEMQPGKAHTRGGSPDGICGLWKTFAGAGGCVRRREHQRGNVMGWPQPPVPHPPAPLCGEGMKE